MNASPHYGGRAPGFARLNKSAILLIGSFVALGELDSASAIASSAKWLEVQEQSACEAMLNDYCLGRYGFTIKFDGTYIAGPSDEGSKAEGRIERHELRMLRELIGPLSTALKMNSTMLKKNCEPGGLPGIKEQLDITFSGGRVVRVYDMIGTLGKLCYVGSRYRVHKLHKFLRGLMNQYYPVPFPSR
jgi:hypothetical protein